LSLFDIAPSKLRTEQTIVDGKKKAGLIVMPTSLIHNWKNEINKFTPDIKVYAYSGARREKNIEKFSNYDLILTSYGIIRNDIDILSEYNSEGLYSFSKPHIISKAYTKFILM